MVYLLAMEKAIQEKLFDLIRKSQKILLALPKDPNGDTLGSSLALSSFLRKVNKEVDIFCAEFDQQQFEFLPGIQSIKREITFPQNFVISLATSKVKVDEISYHQNPETLDFFVKPKDGSFAESDVSFKNEKSIYDLIICLDTPSLEQLGELYTRNAESFYNTPKVNIDNHIKNENFGDINIVDVTASSTAEILLGLLQAYEADLIDADIATDLLTGIIYETNSFQHSKTTPNSFLRASELISLGANQQEIIRYLFKTKEFSVLKLWGRAMARISAMPELGVVYSMLSIDDIQKSGAKDEDLKKVLHEFVVNVADARLVILAAEKTDGVELYISASPNVKLSEIINHFGGEYLSANIGRAFLKDAKIQETEALITSTVKDLKVRLGL